MPAKPINYTASREIDHSKAAMRFVKGFRGPTWGALEHKGLRNDLIRTHEIMCSKMSLGAMQLLNFSRRPGLRGLSPRLFHQTGWRNSLTCRNFRCLSRLPLEVTCYFKATSFILIGLHGQFGPFQSINPYTGIGVLQGSKVKTIIDASASFLSIVNANCTSNLNLETPRPLIQIVSVVSHGPVETKSIFFIGKIFKIFRISFSTDVLNHHSRPSTQHDFDIYV